MEKKIRIIITNSDHETLKECARTMGVNVQAFVVLVMQRCVHSYGAHNANKIQEAMEGSLTNFGKLPAESDRYYLTLHVPSEVVDGFEEIATELGLSVFQGLQAVIRALHVVGVGTLLAEPSRSR